MGAWGHLFGHHGLMGVGDASTGVTVSLSLSILCYGTAIPEGTGPLLMPCHFPSMVFFMQLIQE